jgi:hypothetical protein
MNASVIGVDILEKDSNQNAGVRTSGRSCSHGVGERERERLRIVRKEGKHRSISILVAHKIEVSFREAWMLIG